MIILVVNLRKLLSKCNFKVVKGKENNCYVIKCLISHRVLHDLLHDVAANLVNRLILYFIIPFRGDPTLFNDLGVANFVEDSVAYKLQLVRNTDTYIQGAKSPFCRRSKIL